MANVSIVREERKRFNGHVCKERDLNMNGLNTNAKRFLIVAGVLGLGHWGSKASSLGGIHFRVLKVALSAL